MLRVTKDFIKAHEFISDGLIFLERVGKVQN